MRIHTRFILGACLLTLGCGDDAQPQTAVTADTGFNGDFVATEPGRVQRNVLLIIADDLGTEMLAAYGPSSPWSGGQKKAYDPRVLTPTLTRLAEAGVLFSMAWSSPVCSPTRAGIYTGTYASRNGIGTTVSGPDGLAPKWQTIAEVVKPTIASGLFGKWHLGETAAMQPKNQGFARHAGVLKGGVDDYYCWDKIVDGANVGQSNTFAGEEIRQDAASWIAQQAGPWFAVMATVQPHATSNKLFQLPPSNCYSTDPTTFSADGKSVTVDMSSNTCGTGAPESDAAIPLYKANVECLDRQVDRLIDGLPDAVLERTTVIFIGDNGTPGEVVEGYLDGQAKGTVFEGGIHVPLIIADGYVLVHGREKPAELRNPDPGRIASPGRTVDAPVQTVDLFETILDILGVSAPKQDSVSMSPYLGSASAPAQRTHIFSEYFNTSSYAGAIRDARYKLIYDESDRCYALFDLSVSDPALAEKTNLFTSTELAATIDGLRSKANDFLSNAGSNHRFPVDVVTACPSNFNGH